MTPNYTCGTVLRLEPRYAVLRLDTGAELPVLYSNLPGELKEGDLVFRYDNRWIPDREMQKIRNRRLRSFRSLLKGK